MKEYINLYDEHGRTLGATNEWQRIPDSFDYIIFKDGDIIKAKNGRTGRIEFKGTDEASEIQSAIAALPDGGKIYIAPGLYIINDRINLKSNITIEGAGKATILKKADNFDAAVGDGLFYAYATSEDEIIENIVFKNLTIDGNRDNNTTAWSTDLYFRGAKNVLIEGCYFINAKSRAINFANSDLNSDAIVTNNFFYNCLDGVFFAVKRGVISNNIFIDIQDTAVDVGRNETYTQAVENIVVTDNVFWNVQVALLLTHSNDGKAVYSNNTIIGYWYYGATLYDNASEINLSDNVFYQPEATITADAPAGATQITVDDARLFRVGANVTIYDDTNYEANVIQSIDYASNIIYLENSLSNSYTANNAYIGYGDPTLNCIKIENCSNITVANNQLFNTQQGIFVTSSTNVKVASNLVVKTIKSASPYGIRTDSCQDVFIENNTVIDTDYIGIYAKSTSDTYITKNTILRSKDHGMQTVSSSSLFILNNVIRQSDIQGISLYNSTNNIVAYNVVVENGAGIVEGGTSDYNKIHFNLTQGISLAGANSVESNNITI